MKYIQKYTKGEVQLVSRIKYEIRMEVHEVAIDFLYRGGKVTGKDHLERIQKEKERGNGRDLDIFMCTFHMGHLGAAFL